MSVIPSDQILRLNCPGYGEESFLSLGKARSLDTYSVIIANPVSILHLFDRDLDSVKEIDAKLNEGVGSYVLKSDRVLQDIEGDLKQRIFELVSFLEKGGLLVYFLCRPFMVQGPGSAMDNYYWLESLAPDSPAELNVRHMSAVSHGRIVEPTEQADRSEFASYFKQPGLEWNTIIRSDFLTEGYIVLATAGPRKCIAAHLIAGDNGGRILFLPAPYSPDFDRTLMNCINMWDQGKQDGASTGSSSQPVAVPPPYMSTPSVSPTMFAGLDGGAYFSNAPVSQEPAQPGNHMPPVPKFNANPQSVVSAGVSAGAQPAQILDEVNAKASSATQSEPRGFDARTAADLPRSKESKEPGAEPTRTEAQRHSDSLEMLRTNTNETQELRLDQMPNLTIVLSQQAAAQTNDRRSGAQPRNLLKEMETMAVAPDAKAEPPKIEPVKKADAEPSGSILKTKPEPAPEPTAGERLGNAPTNASANGAKDIQSEAARSKSKPSETSDLSSAFDDMSEYESAAQLDQFDQLAAKGSEKLHPDPIHASEPPLAEASVSGGGFFEEPLAREPEPSMITDDELTESTGEPMPEAKDLIKKMEEMTKTVAPDWCATFSFPDLDDLRKERDSLAETIRLTQSRISAIDNKLAMLDGLKNALLAADGEELKTACSRVFKKLGWHSKQSDAEAKELLLVGEGHTEVIARVVRSHGTAPRPDIAQLAQSVLTYWGETEIEPKGLLIANTFALTSPEDRHEADFSDALAEFAQKKSLCLMTTVQLLCMYRDLELGKLEADQIRNRILDTNGRLVGFELEPMRTTV
jgi:hypothetical protein